MTVDEETVLRAWDKSKAKWRTPDGTFPAYAFAVFRDGFSLAYEAAKERALERCVVYDARETGLLIGQPLAGNGVSDDTSALQAVVNHVAAKQPVLASSGVEAAGWLYDQEVGNVFSARWATKWIERQPGEMRGVRNIRQVFTLASSTPAEASCDDQLAEAKRLAVNVGYMVVPDPVHADGEVHEPDLVVQLQPSLRALGFHAVPINTPAGAESGTGEMWTVESLAQWLHDETEHQESYPHHHWPEHPDDDGNRDGGFVKIVPKHAQAYFRQMAARCLGIRPFTGRYFEAIGATPPATAPDAGVHGPFGYLVIDPELDEEHWRLSDDPDHDPELRSIALFTKEDPFALAISPEAKE